jgi:geranylgeranyl reductase family protein
MISVIGAGPAGSYYSSLAAKNNEVHLFEEDKIIGRPVACTGILTDNINTILNIIPKDLILAKIKKFKIIAPNGKSIYIELKKPDIVLDRAAFDKYLFAKAEDSGAKIHLNEKFLGYKKIDAYNGNKNKNNNQYMIKTSKSMYDTDMIVGADGPNSIVARSAGMFKERKFIQGLQVRAKYPELEEGTIIIHLNLGEFSWIVPENDKIARVGVVGVNSTELHEAYKKLISNAKIIEHQSGIIPLYNPQQQLHKDKENIFLIGDAATQVKATTYGGILYGLHAGKLLSENKEAYEKKFNKTLGKELRLSLKMRELMNSMNDKQANGLIDIFQKKVNSKILSEHDRDYPSKFIMRLMLREPRLWKLGFGILKNKSSR